ncbi:hypothetical protein [Prevotella sp. AGR2160]|uniref:hypothetical protein n=1 Tax=Prevotella sp. AGR2160 TaxID=1280674 RepID=UPI00048A9141|nr:hypothetical protein [Prevotella sp. AGR2160]
MITTKMLWLAAAAVTLVACSGKDKQTANENRLDAQEKSRVVETTTVRERPVSDELELNGEVACDEQTICPMSSSLSSGPVTRAASQATG